MTDPTLDDSALTTDTRSGQQSRSMSGVIAVSRVSGLGRVAVVSAVLGAGYLGNVYGSSNTVPNFVFESLASGALQASLLPALVRRLDRSGPEASNAPGSDTDRYAEASLLASRVMGTLLLVVVPVVAVGMACSRWIAAALVSGIANDAARDRATTVTQILLLVFLPQVLFYVMNLVATAALNAERRFIVPAAAPLLNNLIVIGTLGVLALRFGHRSPTLGIGTLDLMILGVGTTVGVAAFCVAPVISARRRGWRLRPRLVRRDPEVSQLVRDSAWAGGFVISTQVLMLFTAWLANSQPGAVVVLQLSVMLVLVPHALFAVPAATTAFPDLAEAFHDDDQLALGVISGRAVRACTYLTLPAVALAIGLSSPIAKVVTYGRASSRVVDVGRTLGWSAPAIIGLGVTLVLSRVCFASGRQRDPMVVHGSVVIVTLAVTTVVWHHTSNPGAPLLGAAIAIAHVVTAAVLAVRVRTSILPHSSLGVLRPLCRRLVITVAVGGGSWALVRAVSPGSRVASVAVILVASLIGLVVYVGGDSVMGGPDPRVAFRSFGGAPDRAVTTTGGIR